MGLGKGAWTMTAIFSFALRAVVAIGIAVWFVGYVIPRAGVGDGL